MSNITDGVVDLSFFTQSVVGISGVMDVVQSGGIAINAVKAPNV